MQYISYATPLKGSFDSKGLRTHRLRTAALNNLTACLFQASGSLGSFPPLLGRAG